MARPLSTIGRQTPGDDVRFGVIPSWRLEIRQHRISDFGYYSSWPDSRLARGMEGWWVGRAGSGLRNVTIPPSGSFPQANIDIKNLMGNWWYHTWLAGMMTCWLTMGMRGMNFYGLPVWEVLKLKLMCKIIDK